MRVQQKSQTYPASMKISVGRGLIKAKHGSQTTAAEVLNITTRTLRSWKKNAKENLQPCKRGRKKAKVTLGEVLTVAREWRRQGCVGAAAIIKKLKSLRVRVIREVVAGLKKRQRQRYEAHRLKNRTSVKVNKPGVFSVLDAAKEPSKEGGEIIVFKDRGSLKIDVAKSESKATTANDTLRVLNNLKAQGRLPLVAGTDNGSPFVAKAVIEFMEQNQVIHLKSLPSVPQHNGSAENAVGEVKSQIKHGATRDQACQTLNDHRMRESLNWQTATEYDQKNFEPCTKEKRAEFYHATKLAIKEAQLGIRTAYANVSSKNERRKAEREAIFQTMERFSLITRIRGHHHA